MIVYKIPPTKQGILCALFESFTQKEVPNVVTSSDFQPTFDCVVKDIKIDQKVADRVEKGLIKSGGISLLSTLFYALRSNDGLKETTIFSVAHKCLVARKNLVTNYKDPDMINLYEINSRIANEAHRLKGFLRFEKTASGVWYARISPDNDIIDLIAPHFKSRFPNERFLIHDLKRNLVCMCDGRSLKTIKTDQALLVCLHQDEHNFQPLWQTYFDHVTIKERFNPKLQDTSLPKRYRKNMVEFAPRQDTLEFN